MHKPRVLKSSSVREGREASETASPAAASKASGFKPEERARAYGYRTVYNLELYADGHGWIEVALDVREDAVPFVTEAMERAEANYRWKRYALPMGEKPRRHAWLWQEPS